MKRLGVAACLLIAVSFLLFKTTGQKIKNQQPKGAAVPPATEPKTEPRTLEFSHKRVTDAQAAAVLRDMSSFEIPALRRQAAYGDSSAAFILGLAYEVGRGVSQDCPKAARWVAEAANDRQPAAEYNLGLRYQQGDGVPINLQESEKWLRKAAAQNYPAAQNALKLISYPTHQNSPPQ